MIRLLPLLLAGATVLAGASAAAAQTDGGSADTGLAATAPTDAGLAEGEVHIGEGIQVERPPAATTPAAPSVEAPTEVARSDARTATTAVEPTRGASAAPLTPPDEVGASVPSPPAAPILEPPTVADAVDAAASAAVSRTTDRANVREVSIDAQPVASNSPVPGTRLLVAVALVAAVVIVGAELYRRGRTRRV